MVFSSIVFLFFFLPVVLLLYAISPIRYRNGVLLCVSLGFYAWGEGVYLLVMLVSITVNYLCTLFMAAGKKPSVFFLVTGLCFNLGLLICFKYGNFILDNINVFFRVSGLKEILINPIHLPIGISFFTFQAISYLIDVYRGDVKPQKNIVSLGLYISLFPQLIAGPIVRYHHIVKELTCRRSDLASVSEGLRRFIFGLAKKVLLANPLALVADQIFALPASDLSVGLSWLGALCYSLQIYFDFSGYSDMAIGLGRVFGFHFPENFNYPYVARSFREFWRRWHITLSTWLRDYLYIPLGGSRCGDKRTGINLFVVFLLCGLWHGASWTFICWGIYHGCFLILERSRFGKQMARWWGPVQHLWTLFFIMIGWVLFRADSLDQAIQYVSVMLGCGGESSGAGISVDVLLDLKCKTELLVAVILCMPLYQVIKKRMMQSIQNMSGRGVLCVEMSTSILLYGVTVLLMYLVWISLAAGVYNPFIYFRF